MLKALGLCLTLFELAEINIPDELFILNVQARRFYIVELLILWGGENG
jgi:hypothetical protein